MIAQNNIRVRFAVLSTVLDNKVTLLYSVIMRYERIKQFNPWFDDPHYRFKESGFKKRFIFPKIKKALSLKLILSISGLRRVGKTTILRQLANELLAKKKTIFYYQFSDTDNDLAGLLKYYFEALSRKNVNIVKVFILLDELQYVPDWQETLKFYYDLNRDIRFVITGSASLYLHKNTKEGLAGRILDFKIYPLSFDEYLYLKSGVSFGGDIDAGLGVAGVARELAAREKHLLLRRNEVYQFLIQGEFAEIFNYSDYELVKNYLLLSVVDKIFSKDIRIFQVEKLRELQALYKALLQNSAQAVSFLRLAEDLAINRLTVKNYATVLDKSYLMAPVKNYLRSVRSQEKAFNKIFSLSVNLLCADLGIRDVKEMPFQDFKGHIIENYVFNQLQKIFKNVDEIFYFNKDKQEVDFVATSGGNIIPIEVKTTAKLLKKDFSGLVGFLEKKHLTEGLVLYGGEAKTVKIGDKTIYLLNWV